MNLITRMLISLFELILFKIVNKKYNYKIIKPNKKKETLIIK